MRRLHDPRCTIHRTSEEIVVAPFHESIAHAQRDPVRCRRIIERLLQRYRGVDTIERIGKCRANPIAGHFHDRAVISLDRRTRQRVVSSERLRHLLAFLLPQARARLDVGKEYGGDRGRHLEKTPSAVSITARLLYCHANVMPSRKNHMGGTRSLL